MSLYWFPFYVGEYLQDTGHLSQAENGCYLLFMLHCYGKGEGIPEGKRYQIARAFTDDERAACDRVLEEFFHKTDGVFKNPKIENVLADMTARAERSRENGKRGGRRKKTQQVNSGYPRTNPERNLAGNPEANPEESYIQAQAQAHIKPIIKKTRFLSGVRIAEAIPEGIPTDWISWGAYEQKVPFERAKWSADRAWAYYTQGAGRDEVREGREGWGECLRNWFKNEKGFKPNA